MSETVVIGVGNEYRGDDGVGREVVRRLAGQAPVDVPLRESSGEALSLMELWGDATKVILVDATDTEEEPGAVSRMDASQSALPTSYFHASTHAFSVAEAIEMARSLGQLPKTVIVYGIQGTRFEHGHGLSPETERGVVEAVDRICLELTNTISNTKR